MNPALQKFIAEEKRIQGPMPLECAYLIASVNEALNRLDIKGDIMEIGVFEGRSAIPAACYLQEDERFLCIDPFGDIDSASSTLKYGGVGDDQQFIQNWTFFFGNADSLRVLRATSSAVAADEKLQAEFQPFKFISVDGDHSFEGTLLDLRFAARHIAESGVIAVDDVFNMEWPSVSQALNVFLSEQDGFAPFALGWGRLFICKRDNVSTIQQVTRKTFAAHESRFNNLLRVLEPFEYYGVKIHVYTNRWGSASKPCLEPNAHKVGLRYQELEHKTPELAKKIARLLFGKG